MEYPVHFLLATRWVGDSLIAKVSQTDRAGTSGAQGRTA
jgi:hypothetical protein